MGSNGLRRPRGPRSAVRRMGGLPLRRRLECTALNGPLCSQAALPDNRIDNFTSDWNSGIALSALLDYCKPGLFPHWKVLDPSDR